MSTKWGYLFEADDPLRRLERAWQASGTDADREAFFNAVIRQYGQGRFSWDNYTKPLFDDIVKLLKRRRRRHGGYAPYHHMEDHRYMGYYSPSKDAPEAKVSVRAFHALIPPPENEPDQFVEISRKHFMYGQLQIEMEFGKLIRSGFTTPRAWRCDGRVRGRIWGPETDWSDYESGAVPHSTHVTTARLWQAKPFLDMLYSKMAKACEFSRLADLHGFSGGRLNVPDQER